MNEKKRKILKIAKVIFIILVIILIICLVAKLLPIFQGIETEEGRKAFKEKISNLGIEGFFSILGLEILQVVVAFLPGEPLEVLAGMCYGTWGGMCLIFLGAFISSSIIFFAVRKYGKVFIETFLGRKNMEKIEKTKIYQHPEKLELIMLILFLIPGTPKDFLTYLAGICPINAFRFLLIATFVRFPSVISSTFAGENLSDGNLIMVIITYVVTFTVTGICIYLLKKWKQKKEKQENMKLQEVQEN